MAAPWRRPALLTLAAVLGSIAIVSTSGDSAGWQLYLAEISEEASSQRPRMLDLADIIGAYTRPTSYGTETIYLAPNGKYFGFKAHSVGFRTEEAGKFNLRDNVVYVELDYNSNDPSSKSIRLHLVHSPTVTELYRSHDTVPFYHSKKSFPVLTMSEQIRERSWLLRDGRVVAATSSAQASVEVASRFLRRLLVFRQKCRLDSIGWGTCPKCGSYFDASSKHAFYESRHVSCGELLSLLVPGEGSLY